MKIVEVEWMDAHYEAGWKSKDEIEDMVRKDLFCIKLGYILWEDDERVILTDGHDKDEDMFTGFWIIPKGCVLNIKEIRGEEKNEV